MLLLLCRYLNVSHNELDSLPLVVLDLDLQELMFDGNPLDIPCPPNQILFNDLQNRVPSLRELSARACASNRYI